MIGPTYDPGLARTAEAFASPVLAVGILAGLVVIWWGASRRR